MQEFLSLNYEWIRALHIISVMAWMAGLFYLPRLFVYHCGAEKLSDKSETFKIMERKLLKIIMNPLYILSWLFGAMLLLANPVLLSEGWMHVKLACVIAMSVLHHLFARWVKTFAADKNIRGDKFYRWWNEAPTILMIVIVIMAVIQPF